VGGSSRKIEVVGVYRFPAPLGLTQGCLGKTLKIAIGGNDGRATMPILTWTDETPLLALPSVEDQWMPALLGQLEKPPRPSPLSTAFGRVTGWTPSTRQAHEIRVTACVVWFALRPSAIAVPQEYLGGTSYKAKIPDEIRAGIDPWFDRLRTWLEVAVDQDTEPGDLGSRSAHSGGLSLCARIDGSVADLASWGGMTAFHDRFEPLNLRRLRLAIREANDERLPESAHLLLRDARAASRRQNTRLAVIDAGTAVELVLSPYNQTGTEHTLGWYVNSSAIRAAAQLPAEMDQTWVKLRNDVIHRNCRPTRKEAQWYLGLATRVVCQLSPLRV